MKERLNTYTPYLILLLVFFICVSYFLNNQPNLNSDQYGRKIDSLSIEVKKYELVSDSLKRSFQHTDSTISVYKHQLVLLKNKLDNQRKQYEKDINRINAMSNADIAREFTNTFK
jgi:septal ring factor EnvC (AmiA/AmiB activator)